MRSGRMHAGWEMLLALNRGCRCRSKIGEGKFQFLTSTRAQRITPFRIRLSLATSWFLIPLFFLLKTCRGLRVIGSTAIMSEKVTCYKADGTVSPDISCGFTSSSHCCGEGWDCLTNGLCRDHGSTAYSQGSCTDPSFINCLSFCNGGMYTLFVFGKHSHGLWLIKCAWKINSRDSPKWVDAIQMPIAGAVLAQQDKVWEVWIAVEPTWPPPSSHTRFPQLRDRAQLRDRELQE